MDGVDSTADCYAPVNILDDSGSMDFFEYLGQPHDGPRAPVTAADGCTEKQPSQQQNQSSRHSSSRKKGDDTDVPRRRRRAANKNDRQHHHHHHHHHHTKHHQKGRQEQQSPSPPPPPPSQQQQQSQPLTQIQSMTGTGNNCRKSKAIHLTLAPDGAPATMSCGMQPIANVTIALADGGGCGSGHVDVRQGDFVECEDPLMPGSTVLGSVTDIYKDEQSHNTKIRLRVYAPSDAVRQLPDHIQRTIEGVRTAVLTRRMIVLKTAAEIRTVRPTVVNGTRNTSPRADATYWIVENEYANVEFEEATVQTTEASTTKRRRARVYASRYTYVDLSSMSSEQERAVFLANEHYTTVPAECLLRHEKGYAGTRNTASRTKRTCGAAPFPSKRAKKGCSELASKEACETQHREKTAIFEHDDDDGDDGDELSRENSIGTVTGEERHSDECQKIDHIKRVHAEIEEIVHRMCTSRGVTPEADQETLARALRSLALLRRDDDLQRLVTWLSIFETLCAFFPRRAQMQTSAQQ